MTIGTDTTEAGLQVAIKERSLMRLLLPAGLAAAAAVSLFARFHAGAGFLTFYVDDFFYYLRIAEHIAASHHSTFDGTHLTNGYHPLWMLVLAGLVRLFGSGLTFFCVLQTLILFSVLATYALAAYAIAAVAPRRGWLPELFAACIATSTLVLVGSGMEVVLAIPLLAGLVCYRTRYFTWTPSSAFLLGLLAAALVLARLDAAILVIVMAVLDLMLAVTVPLRQRLQCALTYLCGASPVILYLVLNKLWFGSLMPVSGLAKEMRLHHWPSATLFLRSPIPPPHRLFVLYPLFLANIIGLAMLPVLRKRQVVHDRLACLLALLLCPFLYVMTLSLLSDWPIWEWYLYPLIGSGLALALLLAAAMGGDRSRVIFRQVRWPAGAMLLLVWIVFCRAQWINTTRRSNLGFSNYLGGADIAGFANRHPGVYGMGDRAGIPAYLYAGPVVQLEGLVMDKAMLNDIRRQRPLLKVLRDYDVRYYVGVNLAQHGECWHAIEPVEAGLDAPHMEGDICMPPVAEFEQRGYHAMIFDLAAGSDAMTSR
jgi:hypothetical protein